MKHGYHGYSVSYSLTTMTSQNIHSAFLTSILLVIAVFFGYIIPTIKIEVTLVGLFGLIIIIGALRFPIIVIGLLTLVFCDVIPFYKGARPFFATILISILFVLFINTINNQKLRIQTVPRLLLISWFIILASGIISAIYGWFFRNNFTWYVLSELQVFLIWLFTPAILMTFKTKSTKKLIYFMFFMGFLVAIATIFQNFTGISIAGGQIDELNNAGRISTGVVRTPAAGKLFLQFSLLYSISYLCSNDSKEHNKFFLWALAGLTAFSLLLTFGRAVWGSTVFGLLLASILLGKTNFWKTIMLITISTTFTAILIFSIKPELIDAIVDRVISVQREGGSQTSLGWRKLENEYAKQKIYSNPLLGIGLGGEYRPGYIDPNAFQERTHYIHNGYLYLMLKLGAWSVCLPILLSSIATMLGVKAMKNCRTCFERTSIATTTAMFWVSCFLMFTQPEWFNLPSIAFLAVNLALLISILKIDLSINSA